MNSLANIDSAIKKMTSLEISELVGKRHDNVKRTIESLVDHKAISRPQIEVMPKLINNREYNTEVYIFSGEQGKLDSITVVAQLSPEFTAALVKRWYELESYQPNMSATALNKILDDLNVYNKNIKRGRVFKQWFIDKGFGELKQTEAGYPQALFTTKGEQWIHQKFISEGIICGKPFTKSGGAS